MQNFIDVKIVEDRRFWSYDSGRSGGGKCLLLGCARDYPLMGFYKSPHPHLSFSTCRYISQSLQLSASLSKHRTFYLSLSHSLSLSLLLSSCPHFSLSVHLSLRLSLSMQISLSTTLLLLSFSLSSSLPFSRSCLPFSFPYCLSLLPPFSACFVPTLAM